MQQKKILVVGGGIGGMSAAISLARSGHAVELIDLDPQWRVYGAGITITGPTLRAFKALGCCRRSKPRPIPATVSRSALPMAHAWPCFPRRYVRRTVFRAAVHHAAGTAQDPLGKGGSGRREGKAGPVG
jgi:2-polyprenyl-6-methoxyphenol hydroxylase-like FAD-dependent oxidoreductase